MRTKSIFLLLLLAVMPLCVFSQSKSTFEIKNGHFYRNGKITPVLSGEMHYARIPHQYWRHRLQMMKGMGLNTVATCCIFCYFFFILTTQIYIGYLFIAVFVDRKSTRLNSSHRT